MRPLDPRRVYFRLIDEPPVARSGDAHLENVRHAVERLAPIRWEKGYPKVHGRGGWDVVFYVDKAPDEMTFERWITLLKTQGYFPVI